MSGLYFPIVFCGDQCSVPCFFCGTHFHPGLAQVRVRFPPEALRRGDGDVCPACIRLAAKEGLEALSQVLHDQAEVYETLAQELHAFADSQLELPTPEQLEAANRTAHRLVTYEECDPAAVAALAREIAE